ncbi:MULTISPECIES: pyridoxamine 5'-phosphate oxidase family protein [Streptomyces]|uniref:Pyridoxamine 5'-phosphate oxidase family protein n=1 Tax=Streptomyces alfalfae TaxID=1642299 RepID=A0A7T4U1F0_9ACTN|nr:MULTISPECIES: pyridoxamine 5'-phosphate oxidase family protein [Streptomyces]KUL53044.1 pyridoxamine 5'-phosphate oxidase [Streptomyces sp. NRRL S-1521]QQC93155.1 pyridoxamine 5'-phosphate oxidase family protein [Streptomyces alfalfae]THC51908.1 pyridoxamine 5'-phosphate oxidase family protein [Streptomyces sp. A1499]
MSLSVEEREQFLAEPHIGALAVAAGDGRAPLTLPIWYQYAPGGDLWVMTGRHSKKGRLIEAAGRFSLMVDRLEPTVRYVSVEGPVVRTEDATVERLREISARYLPADKVDGYVESAAKEHGEQAIYHLRPEHWYAADLGTV